MAKSKTRYAVLGMLAIEPMSGYQIRQLMQMSTANFWSESDGQLYPALADLTKQGLIVSKGMQKKDAREKKMYRITAKGQTELAKWLKQEAETQTVRSEFMLKLFFGANVEPEVNLEHVQVFRHRLKSKLARLLEIKKQVEREDKDSPHFPYWIMSIEHGIKQSMAQLEWCDSVIRTLEKMKH